MKRSICRQRTFVLTGRVTLISNGMTSTVNAKKGGIVNDQETDRPEVPDTAEPQSGDVLITGDQPESDDAADGGDESADSSSKSDGGDDVSVPGAVVANPTVESQVTDSGSTTDSPETVPAADPAPDSDTSDKHRFRIIHEVSSPGADAPHSVTTSAPMPIGYVLDYLRNLVI